MVFIRAANGDLRVETKDVVATGEISADTADVAGDATVGGALSVTGATSLSADLTVTGGDILADGDLHTASVLIDDLVIEKPYKFAGPSAVGQTKPVFQLTNVAPGHVYLEISDAAGGFWATYDFDLVPNDNGGAVGAIGATRAVGAAFQAQAVVSGSNAIISVHRLSGSGGAAMTAYVRAHGAGASAPNAVPLATAASAGASAAKVWGPGPGDVSGDISVDDVTASGAVTALTLESSNNTTVGGNLNVTGNGTINGNLSGVNTLTADVVNSAGAITAGGVLTAEAAAVMEGPLDVTGDTTVNDLEVGGDLSVSGAVVAYNTAPTAVSAAGGGAVQYARPFTAAGTSHAVDLSPVSAVDGWCGTLFVHAIDKAGKSAVAHVFLNKLVGQNLVATPMNVALAGAATTLNFSVVGGTGLSVATDAGVAVSYTFIGAH